MDVESSQLDEDYEKADKAVFFKRTWISWPVFRFANLIAAPIVSGLSTQAFADWGQPEYQAIVPPERRQ